MIFTYIRVSSKEQNTERQMQAIQDYATKNNIVIDRFYEEKASGKDFNRDIYQTMKLSFRKGDTLIIKELDRLGRDMEQIKDEWRDLQKLGVDIVVLENEMLNTANKTDLEKSLINNILFELLSYMAQKERLKNRERQAEGIAIAKAQGKYKGRKPIKRDNFTDIYSLWKSDKITANKAFEILNMSRATFYRRVREYEKTLNIGEK